MSRQSRRYTWLWHTDTPLNSTVQPVRHPAGDVTCSSRFKYHFTPVEYVLHEFPPNGIAVNASACCHVANMKQADREDTVAAGETAGQSVNFGAHRAGETNNSKKERKKASLTTTTTTRTTRDCPFVRPTGAGWRGASTWLNHWQVESSAARPVAICHDIVTVVYHGGLYRRPAGRVARARRRLDRSTVPRIGCRAAEFYATWRPRDALLNTAIDNRCVSSAHASIDYRI